MEATFFTTCLLVAGLTGCIAATTQTARAEERLTLVFVGDTGTNQNGARVSPEGGIKAGQLLSIETAIEKISPWLQADIVIANLESVVTDRNNISPRNKAFVFRMHPQGARVLVQAGINAFSTANNHALDFGPRGAGETLRNMEILQHEGLLAWPGLGRDARSALMPHTFAVRDLRLAHSAFGIGGGGLPASAGEAGTLKNATEFVALTSTLSQTPADVRIVSVHYGREFLPIASSTDIQRFRRDTVFSDGVSIIAGHHSHVARGVEVSGDHLILYGLGNFLHFGMQNMARFDICRDFGLLVKVTLLRIHDSDLTIETIEAVPLTSMHIQTEPMTEEAAKLRLDVLNYLGSLLDSTVDNVRGVRFAVQENGAGLWCAAGAHDERCAAWIEPELPTGKTALEIERACQRDVRRGQF